jgi:branched-chain amino acid transport system permease protein
MGAYELSLVTLVGINVILALSLNLITGFCGQISLGHAAFYGTGAYACALTSQAGLPFYLGLALGGLVAGAIGLVVGLASLRVRHDFLAITTMGVGFLFLGIVRQQDALGGEIGLTIVAGHGLGSLGFALFVALLAAAVTWFSLYVKRSWMGFSFDAVADDEDTARLVGIDVARYKLTAFALGTALAGVAGGLYTQYSAIIVPDAFGFVVSITILAMVVVGGIGSTFGVLAATVVLTLLPLVFQFIDDYKLLLYGGLLFAVMRFFPGGLAEFLRRATRAGRSP